MDAICGNNTPRLAYAGEAREKGPHGYLLGGRCYSPVLRGFLTPDAASPFGDGGLNRYAYCAADPVNRVDPTGNAWWEWLLAGAGLVLSVAGAIASGGALVGAVGAAGGAMAALGTSAGATAAAAATLDIVSVAAGLGSIATMATGASKAGAIFGWVGLGAGLASMAAGAAAWRLMGHARFPGRGGGSKALKANIHETPSFMEEILPAPPTSEGAPRVIEFSAANIDASRFDVRTSVRSGTSVGARPQMYRFEAAAYPGAVHYGVDTPIRDHHVARTAKKVADEHPAGNLHYYYGSHGRLLGENWAVEQGSLVRLGGLEEPRLRTQEDIVHYLSGKFGERFKAENLASVADLRALYARPGAHIHAYCCSAADRQLVGMFMRDPPSVLGPQLV
jgi:RHS repeat-associated protein